MEMNSNACNVIMNLPTFKWDTAKITRSFMTITISTIKSPSETVFNN